MSLLQPDWPAPDNVVAFSTTRESGDTVRPPPLADLPEPRITQVHGTLVVDAGEVTGVVEADGIISRQSGITCRVVTADCLPILLCNRAGTEIAAVHAGWRGLVAGILENALDRLSSPAQELLAWIGPAIGQANYEVGAELREAFLGAAEPGQSDAVASCFAQRGDKYLADLVALARVRLAAAGVEGVYGGQHCTFADPARFHSWRRDGGTDGRNVTGICILPGSDLPGSDLPGGL
ncbi:MAG: peptidoglycan editing factor PgeF [Halieaceae bacterium]|nr:peptidoglycan editing factor PgeF [Halieaceae bacterium]